jgi:hypothetical protein
MGERRVSPLPHPVESGHRRALASPERGSRWPCRVAIGTYWVLVAVLTATAFTASDRHLIYPLDDAYIHMAIARSAAVFHVWGLTPDGFTSSTSSPLWTSILALTYLLTGVSDVAPLILNLAAGTVALGVADHILRRSGFESIAVAAALLGLVFVTPLPLLTISGMEHTLHSVLALIALSCGALAVVDPGSRVAAIGLLALAPALTMTRYEGLFQMGSVAILLFVRGRRRLAVAVAAAAWSSVAAYAWWSVHQGWLWLPNSVLLKGDRSDPSVDGMATFAGLAVWKAILGALGAGGLLMLSSVAALALLRGTTSRLARVAREANWILLGMVALHVLFASIDTFYRYEAYLVFTGLVAMAMSAAALYGASRLPLLSRRQNHLADWAAIVLLSAVVASLGTRAWRGIPDAVRASRNIYAQQYQMAQLVRQSFAGEVVAVNDVGAVAYWGNATILDLWGLGSLAPARLKLDGAYDTSRIRALVEDAGVTVAFVYDSWFARFGGLPPEWTPVFRWRIPDNIVCGDDTVTAYAVSGDARERLLRELPLFVMRLPAGVAVEPGIR